jgi:hypothetical protein
MSSLSGSAASDDQVPEESKEEVEVPETAPSTSQKRGRPKGSRNKSTLEALAAKAAASTFAAPQATGALRETKARPSEGEWEEDRFCCRCCSFVVLPSWAAAG